MLFSSVKPNLSTSSGKKEKPAATIDYVDLGSKSLVAFGPSIPHKNEQKRNLVTGYWVVLFRKTL